MVFQVHVLSAFYWIVAGFLPLTPQFWSCCVPTFSDCTTWMWYQILNRKFHSEFLLGNNTWLESLFSSQYLFPGCDYISFDDTVSGYDSICLLQISSLIYTSSGNCILALASNAIHLLWKWQGNERNSRGKVNGHQNRVFPPFCTEVILRIVSIFV